MSEQQIAVDVGNSRLKWGKCGPGNITDIIALPHAPEAWDDVAKQWKLEKCEWLVAGVVPSVVAQFCDWARQRGDAVRSLASYRDVPIKVILPEPDTLGLDRLLGAFAGWRCFPNQDLIIVDAGSAITINHVNPAGEFCCGAIMPGLGLMARALHQYTAKLPLVTGDLGSSVVGKTTDAAIRAGILNAAVGGVNHAINTMKPKTVVFTGGDGEWLAPFVKFKNRHTSPSLPLEGLRMWANP